MNLQKFDGQKSEEILSLYYSGKPVKEVAYELNMSTGKAYNILKSLNCDFRRKGAPIGFKQSDDFCKKLSKRRTGTKSSSDTKNRISESKKCHYDGLNGYGHTKKHNRGYILCYVPDHPNAHSDGYVMLHTVLMEISIGRYLSENEVVHHRDGNRENNNINNLELMTAKEHQSMHMKARHSEGGDLYQSNHINR